jgi:hypothetical protein
MPRNRLLTAEEKAHWHKTVLATEQRNFPDHLIVVTILDIVDEEGEPVWHIVKTKETRGPSA